MKISNFTFSYIKKNYPGDRSRLCLTDTDSFVYDIQTEDIHADMMKKENRKFFDWSGYPSNHPVFKGMEQEEIDDLKLLNKKVCVCVCVCACVFDNIISLFIYNRKMLNFSS